MNASIDRQALICREMREDINAAELVARYNEPWRSYRNEAHIALMFQHARELQWTLTEEQRQAILWHDAVYIPGSPLNEEASAYLAVRRLAGDGNRSLAVAVRSIILATKDHRATGKQETDQVIDLDLYEIGDEQAFRDNGTLLEDEMFYGLPVGDLKAYRLKLEGRIAFLKAYSNREHLYATEQLASSARDSFARQLLLNDLADRQQHYEDTILVQGSVG